MPEENIEKKLAPNIENPSQNLNIEQGIEQNLEVGINFEKKSETSHENNKIVQEKISEDGIKGSSLIQSSLSEREKKIESILEVDLADVYSKLSPENKKLFKKKGEETARAINEILNSAKIKIKKILSLIKDWLKIIPGVNSFFIEHLAKKKLDEIMNIKNK